MDCYGHGSQQTTVPRKMVNKFLVAVTNVYGCKSKSIDTIVISK